MVGAARRVLPRAVASALGLAVAVAVLTAVVHAVGWHSDPPHGLRAAPAAAVHAPVLPSRLPDLASAPAAPAVMPAMLGRPRIDTRPVVAPLAWQERRGHADRGPPAVAPTS
jgi:hypothetical protein